MTIMPLRSSVPSLASCFSWLSARYASGSSNSKARSLANKVKGGKKAVGFKPIKNGSKPKAKKSGMTHLEFSRAVQNLGFEKYASDLSNLQIQPLSHTNLSTSVGKMTVYDNERILHQLGTFKKYQYHELFPRPVSMISHNTVSVQEHLLGLKNTPSAQNRICLQGEKGCGKSTLLTQAQSLALLAFNNNLVLLHFEAPEIITDGSSDYFFNSTSRLYHQPMFTKRWIFKILNANEAVFRKMLLTEDITMQSNRSEQKLKMGVHSLYDFLNLSRDFGKHAPTNAFGVFINQLQEHSENFPVFITIDNFNALVDKPITKYRHPDFTRCEFHGNVCYMVLYFSRNSIHKKG